MKRIAALLSVCLVLSAFGGETAIELLPRGRPFRLTFADPREIRMGLQFEGDSRVSANIGNYFSILGLTDEETAEWSVHLGIEGAGYFVMRQTGGRFPLETTDGLIGLYIEGSNGPLQWQTRFTHISAHLSDGSIEVPIAYSRELLALRIGYLPWSNLHVYAGLNLLIHTIPPVRPVGVQTGVTYFMPWAVAEFLPFIGADVQFRQETNVNPSLSLQVGVALNNPPEAFRSFRFFYSYYTGSDFRGQYLGRVLTSHSVGIEMQI